MESNKSITIAFKFIAVVAITFFAGKVLVEAINATRKTIRHQKMELAKEWAEETLAGSGLTIKPLPKNAPKEPVIATLFALHQENEELKIKLETLRGMINE